MEAAHNNYDATIYAATDIDDGSWREIHKQLVEVRRDEKITTPVRMFIYGNGGNCDTEDAIIDLIKEDGNIHGYLIGCAYSAHSSIWIACQRRFVYPTSRIAIHESRYLINQDFEVDEYWLRQKLAFITSLNMRTSRRLAEVSNKSIDWWREQLANARDDYTIFTAHQMVHDLEMAEFAITGQ